MQFSTANPGGDSTVQRDRWGRPLLIPPGGGEREPYTRVTTLAGTIEDASTLTKWQMRMVAKGLSSRSDLHALVSTLDPDKDKAKLNAVCEDAKEAAAASRAANWGTAVHSMLEAIDAGTPPDVLASEIKQDVIAYLKLRKRMGFGVVAIEKFVANPTIKVAGTADRFIDIDGHTYVADIKTGSVKYGQVKMAAQLALYAISHPYDTATDQWGDSMDVDTGTGYILHVPHGQGTAAMYPVDLSVGYQAIKASLNVRQLRKQQPIGDAL